MRVKSIIIYARYWSCHLKRLQIHRRLVYANIFPGPEFLRTSTISVILRGILAATGWVLNLQGEVARRYLRLNGENMQMNFGPLCNVLKFLVKTFCSQDRDRILNRAEEQISRCLSWRQSLAGGGGGDDLSPSLTLSIMSLEYFPA